VRGELACALLTDYPERFSRTRAVLVRGGQGRHRVLGSRLSGERVYLRLEGVADRTTAEALRGAILEVPLAEAVALPPDTYFWHQLIGLEVQTEAGERLGALAEVLPTGGNDVYVVRDESREILLPAIREVVRRVDLERGVMVVSLLPGLAS
jgi:16S rRNA processing protein RimM